ncbi:MAG: sugar phosphate isomerase/epimerase [Acidobacteria bacterium]|nr:sugar phosphate isomerase/epimerase [Acidobacteriota bacterium]
MAAGTATLAGQAAQAPKVKLGIDLFSIRSSPWTPIQFLDYSARLGAKVVHFSEIRFLGSLEESNLRGVREHAAGLGVELELGMRSICPTSTSFDPEQGTAEEQLMRMIAAAKTLGSPIVRCFLGFAADRKAPGGIEGHIANTAKVLRNVRSRALDAGIKIAVENHGGDMQGRELKTLIEEAGKDFTGACIDSGNPLWALEDPHRTLEVLHPYVLTSHVRDTAVWRIPEGAAVQWTRMGEGNVNIAEYVKKYLDLCPGRALSLEIIVTGARKYPYLDPGFWDGYRGVPAWEFARFVALAEKGQPRPAAPPVPKEQAAQREREALEASMSWLRGLLGI